MAETLVIDASVLVKWFKKGEAFEEEALKLRRDVLSSKVAVMMSELTFLEVCRALVKVGYPPEKVEEAYATLREMSELGFLKPVPVSTLIDKAKDLILEVNLYVADALTLAAALTTSSDLLTEDRHLTKPEVKENMRKEGLKVVSLKEMYR